VAVTARDERWTGAVAMTAAAHNGHTSMTWHEHRRTVRALLRWMVQAMPACDGE
jgi:uncharacterized protein YjiS (DUF1127 family)